MHKAASIQNVLICVSKIVEQATKGDCSRDAFLSIQESL